MTKKITRENDGKYGDLRKRGKIGKDFEKITKATGKKSTSRAFATRAKKRSYDIMNIIAKKSK